MIKIENTSNKYSGFVINTAILFITLFSINTGLNNFEDEFIFMLNIALLISYVVWIYYSENNIKISNLISKINILICGVIVTTIGMSNMSIFNTLNSENGMETVLTAYDGFGKIIYFTICFLQPIILPLPEPLTIATGNIIFGQVIGFILGFSGTILGILAMFSIAEVGNKKIKLVSMKNIEKYNSLVKENETFILFMLFIFPILPDEVICIGAGLSPIRFKKFAVIALLSKLITIGVYSMSSNMVRDILELDFKCQIGIAIIITIVFIIIKKIISYIQKRLNN